MKILITGSEGFVGKNLILHLNQSENIQILKFSRNDLLENLTPLITQADFIFHLAGENRPASDEFFKTNNEDLTAHLCKSVIESKRRIPIVFASSVQAVMDNSYGKSKLAAENYLQDLGRNFGNPILIYRLPGIFGKWCKPNYNSVVATFCFNVANNLPIHIENPDLPITLIYIDDVIKNFKLNLLNLPKGLIFTEITPQYTVKLNHLAELIHHFKDDRARSFVSDVGTGFIGKLYSTFISYIPKESFSYRAPFHTDDRGTFIEMIKTKSNGQFSLFTAKPGVIRGNHYHHSKTEKFLVVKGRAKFKFINLFDSEIFTIETSEDSPEIVDSIPGWAHSIQNIGSDDLIVALWSNEIFDLNYPDTIFYEV